MGINNTRRIRTRNNRLFSKINNKKIKGCLNGEAKRIKRLINSPMRVNG